MYAEASSPAAGFEQKMHSPGCSPLMYSMRHGAQRRASDMRRTLAKGRSRSGSGVERAGRPAKRSNLLVLTDAYPMLSETFVSAEVAALRRLGHRVRVEAMARPAAPERAASLRDDVRYLTEEPLGRRIRDLGWVAARHPLRALADLASRRRWRREEEVLPLRSIAPAARRLAREGDRHVHVHFAAGAALSALRLSRLTGVPYSLTAHAYDIYQRPRNLVEKLEASLFATSGCDYTVADLRRLLSSSAAPRVHKIVMGVDGRRFRRRSAYGGGRVVCAVGRLIEKKGFVHLLEATALLTGEARLDRLEIVGDGPLRASLRARAGELGLHGTVRWLGARESEGVREVLEGADLLVMPCVVARDGDRDSMPVVVKEAMAMEVPVVASDEVGLPELVRPPWGRLAPPGDAAALARAIRDVLSRPREERIAMGRAGRAWVLEHCDVERETAVLSRLMEEAGAYVT